MCSARCRSAITVIVLINPSPLSQIHVKKTAMGILFMHMTLMEHTLEQWEHYDRHPA